MKAKNNDMKKRLEEATRLLELRKGLQANSYSTQPEFKALTDRASTPDLTQISQMSRPIKRDEHARSRNTFDSISTVSKDTYSTRSKLMTGRTNS